MLAVGVGVVVATAAPAAPARAEPASARERGLSLAALAAGGFLKVGLAELFPGPDACRWCEPGAFDVRVRAALKWERVALADKTSTITGYVAAPAFAIGGLVIAADDRGWGRAFDDAMPVLQAAVAASVVNQAVKSIAARRRPYVAFDDRRLAKPARVENRSFFSGHTALSFAYATSAGTVASMRGYDGAPVLWAGGLALAATTGYLRVAADMHYATDVLAGALAGAGLGVAIPRLFHRDTLEPADRATAAARPARAPVMWSFGGSF